MRRILLPTLPLLLVLSMVCFSVQPAVAATMESYCQYPTYVYQSTLPAIMLLVSNARTMSNFAYMDNIATSEATASGGFDKTKTYYGYFDSAAWYDSGGASGFTRSASKSSQPTKGVKEVDGNFLNWLCTTRIDVMKKVLTGGTGDTYEFCGDNTYTRYKKFYYDAAVHPNTFSSALPIYATFSYKSNCTGNSPSTIDDIYDHGGTAGAHRSFGTKYSAKPKSYPTTTGLIQKYNAKAKIGLTFYNESTSEGGRVQKPCYGAWGSSDYNKIKTPSQFNGQGDSPLAEALWTITGYFAQVNSTTGAGQGSCTGTSNCGPNYDSSYSIGSSNDPYLQNSSASRCVKGSVIILSDGEPCNDANLPSTLANYAGTAGSPYNCVGSQCDAVSGHTSASTIPACTPVRTLVPSSAANGGALAGVEDVALWAHTKDLRNSPTFGVDNIANSQALDIFVIRAFGLDNSNLLKYAAINGTFDTSLSGVPNAANYAADLANGYTEADDGDAITAALDRVFSLLIKRAASGTAASVLASGEGSGANLVQAVFYPRRQFTNDLIHWSGSLQNLWYYVDPFVGGASIREDSDNDNTLNIHLDNTVEFVFDQTSQKTVANVYANDSSSGLKTGTAMTIPFENLNSLWEAGNLLHATNPANRKIFTALTGSPSDPLTNPDFTTGNLTSTLTSWLGSSSNTEAQKVIDYVRGTDTFNSTDNTYTYRQRTVDYTSGNAVWKLGDIVNSTPRIASSVALNKYDTTYNDTTYTQFVQDNTYQDRGMVFVGGNDGMLHAFKLGKLSFAGMTGLEKAEIINSDTSIPTGTERWAFIPKNALPYLAYQMDNNYCHVVTVDLATQLFDASIGEYPSFVADNATRTPSSWRTILIGGMRHGGACRDNTASCNSSTTDCVKTPMTGKGYSSYFALDVTDPEDPKFLWEFSHPALGFASTGAAVVRMNAHDGTGSNNRDANGHWYVVLGSGPTGPIDGYQFLGRSDQNLKLFVLDLKTGTLQTTNPIDNNITLAFAGSMVNASADFNLDYEDDAVYLGYVKKDATPGTWTQGGVARLQTNGSRFPSNWTFTKVIDNIGPVTSSIARLQSNSYGISWLFFGTGRYFFESSAGTDDATGQRYLYGVKEPCFNSGLTITPNCSTAVTGTITTVTDDMAVDANLPTVSGWNIALDTVSPVDYGDGFGSTMYDAERVITDPLATSSGFVFFTTFRPYGSDCSMGGRSFLWALRYNTGTAAVTYTPSLKGKALLQVSTGSIEQFDFSTAFGATASDRASALHRGGRRTGSVEGIPPTGQGLSIISYPPAINRVIHMREK